jgi:hypothetical protein
MISTVEEWRTIVLPGLRPLYEVSNMGCIRSLGRPHNFNPEKIIKGRTMRPSLGPRGYLQVFISDATSGFRRNMTVHRLVAAAFIPNPNNLPEINHIDLDKTNNRATNLEWVSRHGNYLHASEAGVLPFRTVITKDVVAIIKAALGSGASQSAIARRFDINQSTVSRIWRGIRRVHG